MPRSRNHLSLATSREPFGKVTELFQVPIALFEIAQLASEIDHPKAKQIVSLIDDTINVTLDDPEALVKLSNAAGNGYRIRFSAADSAE
ncbi:MAG: hypothetical protein ACRD9Y_18150 [Blastocatellia bacterium]